jgi:hypothetical protein
MPPVRWISLIRDIGLLSSYFLPDRTVAYAALLRTFADSGYTAISIHRFAQRLAKGEAIVPKSLVLRHDIDTDPTYTIIWHGIEKSLGFEASYYFRLRTADVGIMRRLADEGDEVGYHYEEIASYAKAFALRSPAEIEAHMPQIRDRFLSNLEMLRRNTGLPIVTAAGHGDFMNRRLLVNNSAILANADLRRRAGIYCEAYDRSYLDHLNSRVSDAPYPERWLLRTGKSLREAMAPGDGPIEILTHPRWWRASVRSNFREDFLRLILDMTYRAGLHTPSLADFADRISREAKNRDVPATTTAPNARSVLAPCCAKSPTTSEPSGGPSSTPTSAPSSRS